MIEDATFGVGSLREVAGVVVVVQTTRTEGVSVFLDPMQGDSGMAEGFELIAALGTRNRIVTDTAIAPRTRGHNRFCVKSCLFDSDNSFAERQGVWLFARLAR